PGPVRRSEGRRSNPSPQPPPRSGEGEKNRFCPPSPLRGGGWGEGFCLVVLSVNQGNSSKEEPRHGKCTQEARHGKGPQEALRWIANHFKTQAALASIWPGRAATSCEAPGMRTRAVSTLRNFSAWQIGSACSSYQGSRPV